MPVRTSWRDDLKPRWIHRVNAASGYHHNIFLRIAARVDGPENVSIIEDVHIFVDGDGDLGVQDRTRQNPHEDLLRFAGEARRHLHDDAKESGKHERLVDVDVADAISDVVVYRHSKRNFVKNTPFNLGAILNRLEDRITAHRDAVDLDYGIFPHAGNIVIVKFRERSFVFAHVGKDLTLENDLRVIGHLEIIGLAFHDLYGLADQPPRQLQLIHLKRPRARGGHVVERMVADENSDGHRLISRLILVENLACVARHN